MNQYISTKTKGLSPPVSEMDAIIENHQSALLLFESGFRQIRQALHMTNSGELKTALRKFSWYCPDSDEQCLARFEKELNKSTWETLFQTSKLLTVMNASDVKKLKQDIALNAPPLTRENVLSTFVKGFSDRIDTYEKGVIELFQSLCKNFRSHKAFQLEKRIILDRAFDEGLCSYRAFSNAEAQINDIMRIFMLLDQRDPSLLTIEDQLGRRLERAAQKGITEYENEYFSIKFFNNGNVHLWFTRIDLVEKVNNIIAKHNKNTLPDST